MKRSLKTYFSLRSILFSFCFLLPHFLFAQTSDATALIVKKANDFQLTGKGSSNNWNHANWITLPKRNKTGVYYQTKFKLLYSDSGIYCLYYCEDKKITATLKEDFADLYDEDVVEAFFWTDEETPLYFEYELSPYNFELPIIVPNNKGYFFGWLPWHYEGNRKTKHAAHIQKEGDSTVAWTAEFYIPFALLKPLKNIPPKSGTKWRANFYRIDYDSKTSYWSWQLTRTNFHDYEKFGTIVFE